MQSTVRTTIRIRKDLLDQSKLLALRTDSSLQEVVNQVLAQGFSYITDLDTQRAAMDKIDAFREKIAKSGRKVDVKALLEEAKKDLK